MPTLPISGQPNSASVSRPFKVRLALLEDRDDTRTPNAQPFTSAIVTCFKFLLYIRLLKDYENLLKSIKFFNLINTKISRTLNGLNDLLYYGFVTPIY